MTLETVIVASPDQVSCDLGEEAAILSLKSGVYYGLDPVGARIWSLLKEPRTVAAIRDAIVAEYDVTPERAEQDLFDLLAQFSSEGLIETRAEQTAKA